MLVPVLRVHAAPVLHWRDLPALPKALGGQFAGVAGDRLIVAGGSYFDTPPWNGGVKQRVDTIYALGPGEGEWRLAGKLPYPVASGAAAATPDGLVCTGGQGDAGNTAECHTIRFHKGSATVERFPSLPSSLSMHSTACDGTAVYVAGGQLTPQSTEALRSFYSLNLDDPGAGWKALPPVPGPGRILPILIAARSELLLISGSELTGTPGPPPGRRFLTDAYRFSRNEGWRRIADVPVAVQGGSGGFWKDRALVFSGNDGTYADKEYEMRERHPGFSKNVLCYDLSADRWTVAGAMPAGLVTSGVSLWRGEFVIAGGEARPAYRSAEVLACRVEGL